jgi:hypothetical protein
MATSFTDQKEEQAFQADPDKWYAAILYYWTWGRKPDSRPLLKGMEDREGTIRVVFRGDCANDANHKVTDLAEVAERAIVMRNSGEPIPSYQRIRLEVFELVSPQVTVHFQGQPAKTEGKTK